MNLEGVLRYLCFMKLSVYLFCLSSIIACNLNTNCISKESFLSGYEKFVDDVKNHHDKIEIGQWKSIDQEFASYTEDCYPKYKEQLSTKERVDFWKHTLSYGVYRGKNDDLYEFIPEDYGLNLEEEIELLTEDAQEELETFIKEEIGPELEGAIESLIDELEGLGEQFKEWLDNL